MMPSSLTQNNNSNRVKNIRSKFEVLSEPPKIALKSKYEVSSREQPKNVKIVKLQNTTTVPINLTKDKNKVFLTKLQLCKVNSDPSSKFSTDNAVTSKDKFGPPCNFGNRKRLKENFGVDDECQNSSHCIAESQHNFLDERKMPKSLNLETGVLQNAESEDVGKENISKNENLRALSRQFSDPTKKLHRSPAFRCDRSEKIRDSRKNSFNSDCSDHSPQPSETDRCKLSKDKLKILGLLLEEKMKQDSFEFSKPKRINRSDENSVPINNDPQTLDNVYQAGVKNVDVLSKEAVNSDVQIPQHILDQYAQVIKPKNKIIKKATVKTDAVFSDSGVSSESENLISDDLEEIPVVSKKTNSFNSIRSNFEVTNAKDKEEFISNRRKVLKQSVDDEYNQYFDEKSSSERLLEDTESSTNTIIGITNDSTQESLTTSFPIEGGDKNSLTDTLKKVLKQPLPPGPPPKKPPRTFAILSPDQASTSKSPDLHFDYETAKRKLRDLKVKSMKQHRSKEESKLMLAKIENALRKHESSGKIMSPRPIKKFTESNSASNDTDTSLNDSNGSSKSTSKLLRESPTKHDKSPNVSSDSKPKDVHYMCTEILDLHFPEQGNMLNSSNVSLNSSEGLHKSNSFAKCLNSLNCTSNSLGKNTSGQNYTKLGSFGNNSNRNSMTSMCCSCNFDAKSLRSSVEDITSPNMRLRTFMPTSIKNNDSYNNSHNFCDACKENPGTHQFTCHINNSSTPDGKQNSTQPAESKSTFFVDRKAFSRNSDTKSQYGVLKKSKSQEHIYAEPYEFQRLRHEQEVRPNVSPPNRASFEIKPALLRSGTQLEDGFGRAREPDLTKIITNPPIQQNKDIFGNPRRLSSSNYGFEQVDAPEKQTSEYASTSLKSFQSDSNKDYNVRDYKTLETNRRSSKEFNNKTSAESNGRNSSDFGNKNANLQNSGSKVKDILMRLEGGRSSLRIVRKKDNDETTYSTGRKFHHREMSSSPIRDTDHRADEIKNDEAIERRLSYLASKIYDTPYAETPFPQRTLPKPPSDGPSSNTSFLYGLPTIDQTVNQTINETVNQPRPSFSQNGLAEESSDLSSNGAFKRPPMYDKKISYYEGQTSALYRLTETPNRRNIHDLRKRRSPTEIDRENLNRLMTEIYDTVAEACILDGNTSGETDHDTGDEVSLKLTRSLTEKRKRYVRRVSSRAGFISPGSVRRNRQSNNAPNASNTTESNTNISNSSSEDISNSETKPEYKDYATFPMRRKQTLKTPDPGDAETNPNNYMATYSSFPLRQASRVGEDIADEAASPVSCCDYEEVAQPQINKGGLFDSCILVGMNFSTGEAYVKSVFPEKTALPPRMESLVFPECSSELDPKSRAPVPAQDLQDYALVLTNERGARSYGYCRRVLPEGASHCLPLAYCIVSRYRAPAFYYKVLQEIESRHGSSDFILNSILTQLYNSEFPRPGHYITLKQLKSPKRIVVSDHSFKKNSTFRNSVNLGEVMKSIEDEQNAAKIANSNSSESLQAFPKDCDKFRRKSTDVSAKFPELYNKDNSIMKSLERIYGTGLKEFQSVLTDGNKLSVNNPFKREFGGSNTDLESTGNVPEEIKFEKVKVMNLTEERIDKEEKYRNYSARNCLEFVNIKRPLEPRLDEDNLSVLFDSISVSVLVKIFGTLLIERKVVIVCDKLSKLSACMEGLQSILYPFTWQHVLISSIPAEIRRDMMEAPIPILCGLSHQDQDIESLNFQEGMVVDISRSCKDSPCERVIKMQGDEASLLPPLLAKTLKASLQLGPPITSNAASDEHARKTRNVLVAEAFLRFFVELLGDYRSFFKEGTEKVEFEKEQFIRSARSKHVQYFLEWFTETAMFGNFIHQRTSLVSPAPPKFKSASIESEATSPVIDLPYPDFYELFDERVSRRASTTTKSSGNGKDGVTKGNYKMIVNKKVKVWRDKLRDLVN